MKYIAVKVMRGYGGGFDLVEADDAGRPVVHPGRKVTKYIDGERMSPRVSAILAQPSVHLFYGHVAIPPGAVEPISPPFEFERYTDAAGAQIRIPRHILDLPAVREVVAEDESTRRYAGR